MGNIDPASILVTIGFMIVSTALYYKFWYLNANPNLIIQFLTIFVFGGTVVLILGCVVKYFGYSQENLEALR